MNKFDRLTIRSLILPILLLALLLLAACDQGASQPEPTPTPASVEEKVEDVAEEAAMLMDLAGTSWVLDSIGELDADLNALEGVRSTLNFSVVNYLGTGGCNWYQGVYFIDSPSLTLKPPFQTRLSCTEPEGVMTQEGAFWGPLFSTTDYMMEDDKLVLLLDGTQRLATFSPAEPVEFEGTNWGLKALYNGQAWFQVVIESEISAQFIDGDLTGNSGCNDYAATYVTEGRDMSIEGLESTDETCDVSGEVMDQEAVYLEQLELVAGHEVLGGSLTLVDANGEAIMFFGAQ